MTTTNTGATMDKKTNYTDEQVAEMIEAYSAVDNDADREAVVNDFADQFKKSKASIRAKLVREGVYVKKTRTTKTGGKIVSKADIIVHIASYFEDRDVEFFDSLEKANKNVLAAIAAKLGESDNDD